MTSPIVEYFSPEIASTVGENFIESRILHQDPWHTHCNF
jgi:hypothetical protein